MTNHATTAFADLQDPANVPTPAVVRPARLHLATTTPRRQVAVVLGAAGPIGAATSRSLRRAGLTVIGVDQRAAPSTAGGEHRPGAAPYIHVRARSHDSDALHRAFALASEHGCLAHVIDTTASTSQQVRVGMTAAAFTADVERDLLRTFTVAQVSVAALERESGNRSLTLTVAPSTAAGAGLVVVVRDLAAASDVRVNAVVVPARAPGVRAHAAATYFAIAVDLPAVSGQVVHVSPPEALLEL